MRRVEGPEFKAIKQYFTMASEEAVKATCKKARCGSVIVSGTQVIGRGYNSPAAGNEDSRMCEATFDTSLRPKYDKTCCVHAEWRAVLDACKIHPDLIENSVLYFMRVDDHGGFTDAGDPFCTVCSRLTYEAGVREFALYNDDGADIYTLDEYNLKSYEPYLVRQ